jgi:hypothetical protein
VLTNGMVANTVCNDTGYRSDDKKQYAQHMMIVQPASSVVDSSWIVASS